MISEYPRPSRRKASQVLIVFTAGERAAQTRARPPNWCACATVLGAAGQSPRAVADQLGHDRISTTHDRNFGRRIANPAATDPLDAWDFGGSITSVPEGNAADLR